MVYTGKRKYIKKSFIFVLFILLVLQMSAVIKIEILTAKYYDIFQDAYKSNTMLGEMDSFKEKVTLCEYNNMWAELFQKEQDKIDKALKGNFVSIEHVGSTSVPGLCAKPRI